MSQLSVQALPSVRLLLLPQQFLYDKLQSNVPVHTSTSRTHLYIYCIRLKAASPTSLHPRQYCAEVELGASEMLTQREASTPRLRLYALALPPPQHCVEVALGREQVHLGYASLYLLLSLCCTRRKASTPAAASKITLYASCMSCSLIL